MEVPAVGGSGVRSTTHNAQADDVVGAIANGVSDMLRGGGSPVAGERRPRGEFGFYESLGFEPTHEGMKLHLSRSGTE